MRSPANLYIGFLLFPLAVSFHSFAQNAAQKGKADASKLRWENPRKGKIWDKVNVVQIPLTAYENHLMGPVRLIAYKDYKVSFKPGNYQQEIIDSGYNTYDRFGHLIYQKEYKPNGTLKWNCVYKYDGKNLAAEWDFKFEDAAKNSKTTFKYDDKGNEIERSVYDDDGKLTGKEIKKHDDKGNETEHASYDANGNLKDMETYKYDKQGYQVEWKKTDADGKLVWKMTCEYDSLGNKSRGESYRSETGATSKWTENNDVKKRTIERMDYNPDGSTQSKSIIKYDTYGNIVEHKTFKPDGAVNEEQSSFYDYGYDNPGNKTKATEFKLKDGKKILTNYTQAQVTYY